MSVTEDQIIKDVQEVCKQAVDLGKHLNLTARGVIQQLIDDLKHDEEFVNSKPIKKLIKDTAAVCLKASIKPESDSTDQMPSDPKNMAGEPEQTTIKEDSEKPEGTSTRKDSVDQSEETKSTKKARGKGGFKSSEMVDSDGNSVHENEESTSTVRPTSKPKVKRERKTKGTKKSDSAQESKKNGEGSDAQNSESEEKPASSTPAPKSGKGKRRETLPVDKDEERIKKLKSFVVACGVRKQWKKEFQDLPTSKQQIGRLTKILDDLGMTGRLSMNKAKEIKARRDLEAEVSELVATRETESSNEEDEEEEGGDQDEAAEDGNKKKSSVRKRKKNRTVNASSGDESSDTANKPRKKRNPFAFLGDQGSEDSS
ncbi:hypothetical protein PTTG_05856 [Puccinia triticina 1-1 BBBD Race 1]|uniref:Uncharacterized protein n=2 Tax=Puccinia triticina TaxID=208348 RepID=A0A180GA56_PUCT1|nr:uncharacterized protein PtA15_6A387 [Puccinia triticina]OAV89585.1 hypothetical protein PTTG_05856 [Puccinia triticina 1-1 BBBD Race 1]WAQ85758.1 hypothetical protein PtA15_6A387 [Puccinia triticina]WAR55635.1 hypothetical protein PtB15_6B378 [Puccinia triticina]